MIMETTAMSRDILDIDDKHLITLINSNLLLEDDIIPDEGSSTLEPRKALPNKGGLWLDRRIPYQFHQSVNESSVDLIEKAMRQWENQTCLHFVLYTNEQTYLRFRTDSEGCYTFVGRKYQGPQDVILGPGCLHLQIVLHEIGHSIGFFHEHSRRDRGSALKILWNNIENGRTSQFQTGNDNNRGVPYDVTSVMHYSPMSFSSRMFEKNTMVSLDPHHQPLIGASRGVTFRDAKLANLLYKCNADCTSAMLSNVIQCENEGYIALQDGKCQCRCPPNTEGIGCQTVVTSYYGISCGGDIYMDGQIIETPGYPSRLKGTSCTWKVQAPEGKKAGIEIVDFSFRPRHSKTQSRFHELCIHEHVEIRTRDMDEGDMYCGTDLEPGTILTSSSDVLWILIKAEDNPTIGRGLKARTRHL